MAVRLFHSPHWKVLEDAIVAEWQKNDDALILVPSALMRERLLTRLAEETGGVHGKAVVTMERFAEHLAQQTAPSLYRLAQPMELRLAALPALPDQWRTTGIVDAFLNAVEELELHGLTPDEVAKTFNRNKVISNFVDAWRQWKCCLNEHHLWSVGDVLRNACEALNDQKASLPRKLLIYGFSALTDLRWEFLQRLIGNAKEALFFVFYEPENESAYCYAQPLWELLQDTFGVEGERLTGEVPDEVSAILKEAFQWRKAKPKLQSTERVVIVRTAGEEQEVETALQWLTLWRREGKLERYGDALLLARNLDAYLPALEAVSARYEIPLRFVGEQQRPAWGLRQLLWAIAEARRSNLDGMRLWQLLPSPYLHSRGKPLLPPNKHREVLERLRKSWVQTGAEAWQRFFNECFPSLAQQVGEFLKAIEALPLSGPACEHARAWRDLLSHFVQTDEPVFHNLRKCLNTLLNWETNLSLDEFVASLMKVCTVTERTQADAVQVANVSEGRGLWAPVVIVLGLCENRFPQAPPAFELLTDEHRKCLKGRLKTPLRFRRYFLASEMMCFVEAIGAATERLVLTYPCTDADGKPRARSLFVDAVENALEASGWQWVQCERDLADVLPRSLNEALGERDAERWALFGAFSSPEDEHEARALTASLMRDDAFATRLRMEWRRWTKPQEGEWDGKVPSISERVVARLREKSLPLTALEDYGHCPFRFFARHLLRLKRPEEIAYAISPAIKGTLWHAILSEFLQLWQEQGTMPDEATLRQIVDEKVQEELGQTPQAIVELVQEQLGKMVAAVWKAEEREAKAWRPIATEKLWQLPLAELGEVPEALRDAKLQGKTDRIDEGKDGFLRVVDYKTGSAPSPQDIRNGISLQLPFYALLAERHLRQQVQEAHFLRLRFNRDGSYSKSCQLRAQRQRRNDVLLSEMQQEAMKWVCKFLQGIATGDFCVCPFNFETSCRRCDFKALCRRHPLRITPREQQGGEEGE
jgi:ATP-dependent helicase/DNAse subunit B